MRHLAVIFGGGLALLVANFIFGQVHFVQRDFDLAYFARHCGSLTDAQRANISDHVTYDRAATGAVYIFDQMADGTKESAFIIARRSVVSEILCFPVLGCVVPPQLAEECVASGVTE